MRNLSWAIKKAVRNSSSLFYYIENGRLERDDRLTVIAHFDDVCRAPVERYACCSVANELSHFLSGKRIDFGLCAFRTVDGYQAVGVTYRDVFGIYGIDSAGVIEGYGIDMLILGIYLEVVSLTVMVATDSFTATSTDAPLPSE